MNTLHRITVCLAPALLAGGRAAAQQSAQFLDAPVLAVAANDQRMNAVLDLDGDGFMDAVGTFMPTSEKGAVSGFRNDGTGRLEPAFTFVWTQYGDNDMKFPVDVADFNQDGRTDFAVGLRDEVRVFLSNGAAPPTQALYLLMPSGEVQDLAIADYDGNGTFDIAVRLREITIGEEDRGIRIFHKLFTPTPTQSLFFQTDSGTGFQIRAVEATGDVKTDLACAGFGRVDLFRVVGGSAIAPFGSFTHGLASMPMAAAGDIDGDLDQDIVVFGMDGQYRVLRRTGPAAFVLEPTASGGPATDLADVDQDGDLDGVCCGGGGPTSFTNGQPSWFEIAKNDGSGAFAGSFKLPSMGANHIAGVVDLDHDGDRDLVAGRVVYYSVHGIEPAPSAATPDYLLDGRIADLDGDGDPDALATPAGFLRNDGAGAMTAVARVTPAPPAGSTFVGPGYGGDFDGDGDADLIVHEAVDSVPFRERLLLNNGGGGLSDGGPATAPGVLFGDVANGERSFAGDFNGDGRIDIAVLDTPASGPGPLPFTTRCFVRDASGQFVAGPVFASECVKWVEDFDGDGLSDLLLATNNDFLVRFGDPLAPLSELCSLMLGQSWTIFPILERPGVGDLDGDGDADIVVGMNIVGEIWRDDPRICENAGARQFIPHDGLFPDYVGAMLPTLVADVNGDGAPDLLFGERVLPGGTVILPAMSVFLGTGATGFSFAYQGEQWPLIEALEDFDGDGDLDASGVTKVNFSNHHFRLPDSGFRKQYGAATASGSGQTPTLGATGPFRAGEAAALLVTGAPANAGGLLVVGLDDQAAKLGATGGFIVTLPIAIVVPIAFPGDPSEDGSGALAIPYTVPAAAVGASWFHQVVTVDPTAQGGAAVSNGLELHYGP